MWQTFSFASIFHWFISIECSATDDDQILCLLIHTILLTCNKMCWKLLLCFSFILELQIVHTSWGCQAVWKKSLRIELSAIFMQQRSIENMIDLFECIWGLFMDMMLLCCGHWVFRTWMWPSECCFSVWLFGVLSVRTGESSSDLGYSDWEVFDFWSCDFMVVCLLALFFIDSWRMQ